MAQFDRVHELPDGRRLGYCCYGADDGFPVVALHGTPGSRYKFSMADAEAVRLGLKLICPDRWGYGLSDVPRGSARLSDYVSDIDSLLAELGIKRLGIVGVSGGGPYALALAAGLRERTAGLALVAPVAPIDRPERRQGVSLFHRCAFRVLPRLPGIIPLAFSYFRIALALSPALAIWSMAVRAGRMDRELLSEPDIAADLVRTFKAGLARGVRGPSIDMKLFGGDWKIDHSGMTMPARMWLGTQDRNIPVAAARRLAEDAFELDVIELEKAGHFWITRNFPVVLGWLASQARAEAWIGECEQAAADAEG